MKFGKERRGGWGRKGKKEEKKRAKRDGRNEVVRFGLQTP